MPAQDITGRHVLCCDMDSLATVTGCEFELQRPEPRAAAIRFNAPWEGDNSAFGNIIWDPDEDHWKLFYRASKEGYNNNQHKICLATSETGRNFTRTIQSPQFEQWLGQDTNIIFTAPFSSINFLAYSSWTPNRDTKPGTPADEIWKVICGRSSVFALKSTDAITWTLMVGSETDPNGPVGKFPIMMQSQATAAGFHSSGFADGPVSWRWDAIHSEYRCWPRVRVNNGGSLGIRANAIVHAAALTGPWTGMGYITFVDGAGSAFPQEEFYTQPILECPTDPTLLISLPARFEEFRTSLDLPGAQITGTCDIAYMSSRDGGAVWERRFPDPFLSPNERLDWAGHGHNVVPALLETGPEEWSFYVLQRYRQPQIYLQRYTVKPDRFVGLFTPWSSGATVGNIISKDLTFTAGSRLFLNFKTNASQGYVKVELQNGAGAALTGFALADHTALYGDRVGQVVTWAGGFDISALANTTFKVRLTPYQARIFSFWVA